MTYTVYFETKEHMTIGDEDFGDLHHLFEKVDVPISTPEGLTIIYGDKLDPAFIFFIPMEQIKQIQVTRD